MSESKDPIRWTDPGSGATPFESRLLRDARAAGPPPGLKSALRAEVLARAETLAASPEKAASAPPQLAPSARLPGVAPKWSGGFLRVAVVGLASGALFLALRSAPPPSASDAASSGEVPASVEPAVESPETRAEPPPDTLAEPPPDTLAEPPPDSLAALAPESGRQDPGVSANPPARHASTPESRLREESALVLRARERLRAGDPAGALRLLADARSRFPQGALGQEREALTIEALAAERNTGEARAHAEEFLRENPDSPHGARVRAIAAEADGGIEPRGGGATE